MNMGIVLRHIRNMSAEETSYSTISSGFIDTEFLENIIDERDVDYYFCCPEGFMRSVEASFLEWDIPRNQIRFKFFGPRLDA